MALKRGGWWSFLGPDSLTLSCRFRPFAGSSSLRGRPYPDEMNPNTPSWNTDQGVLLGCESLGDNPEGTRKLNSVGTCQRGHHRPVTIHGKRSEREHLSSDPKGGELYLARVKSGETLMEARSGSNVQIDRQSLV